MLLANRDLLLDFQRSHPDAAKYLKTWVLDVIEAEWEKSADLRAKYPSARVLDSQNVIFNIRGNRYRLWVSISYKLGVVRVKAIGTHSDYDNWKIR